MINDDLNSLYGFIVILWSGDGWPRSSMMDSQRFAKPGVLHRVRSGTLEIFDENERQDAREKRQAGQVDPMQDKPIRMNHRHDVEGHIVKVHHPHPNTKWDHQGYRKL